MTFLNFSEAKELPEGVDIETLNSDAVQSFIKTQFDTSYETRFETEAGGLKKTNADLKAEKQRLQEFFDTHKDIDVDEIKQLRTFKANAGEAGQQLESMQNEMNIVKAERDGIKGSYEEKMATVLQSAEVMRNELYSERRTNQVMQGIRDHNAKYPTVSVKEGNERWIADEAAKVFVLGEDGKYTPMNGDRVMTGTDGNVLGYSEWVNTLRDRPDFQSMFNLPEGGGAMGSNGKGGRHFNPADMAGDTNARQRAIAAKYGLTE